MPDTIQIATQKIRSKKEELLKDGTGFGNAKSAVWVPATAAGTRSLKIGNNCVHFTK